MATVGCTCFPLNGSGQTWYQLAQSFDNTVGRPMMARKQYYQANSFPAQVPSQLSPFIAAGQRIWLCLKPAINGSQLTQVKNSIQVFANAYTAKGLTPNLRVVLYQEAQNALSASDYITCMKNHYPSLHSAFPGVPVVVDLAGSQSATATSYFPGASYCDEVGMDLYASSWANGHTADALAALAAQNGKPFGFPEMGSTINNVSAPPDSQIKAYLNYIIGLMLGRVAAGQPVGDCMWYEDLNFQNENIIASPSNFRIPYLQTLFDGLQPGKAGIAQVTEKVTLSARGTDSGAGDFGSAAVSETVSLTASGATAGRPAVQVTEQVTLTTSGGQVSAIVQQVSGSSAFDYGASSVEMTTTEGNTLVVLAGWDLTTAPTAAPMPAVYVHDSANNYWYHAGTSTAGVPGARCSAWICPNAMSIEWLSVSLTTFSSSLAYTVLELNGLPQYYSPDISDTAGNGFSRALSLSPGTTTDVGFAFTVVATGAITAAPAAPAGWSALTSVTSSGGLPSAANPVQIFPYFIAAAAGTSLNTTFTLPQAVPVAAATFAVKSTALPPVQEDQDFPVIKVEAGFGFTPGDPSQPPPDWTDITGRVIGPPGQAFIDIAAGRQYEQAAAEAGVMEIWLDNHTGDFTPGNAASIYAPGTGVVLETPVRVSAFWGGRWFALGYGYVERWPQEWPDLPQWGVSKMIATDVISVLAAATMLSALDSDVLIDAPYVLLNASEQYLLFSNGLTSSVNGFLGSQSAADAQGLPAQNFSRFNQRPGMYVDGNGAGTGGNGAAFAATGQTTNLLGSASTGFGTAMITGPYTGPSAGPGIIYTDPGLPSPALPGLGTFPVLGYNGGVTVSFWVIITGAVAAADLQPVVLTAYGPPSSYLVSNASLTVQILNQTGNNTLQVTLADGSTVSAPFTPAAAAQAITLVFTASALTIYVNGAQATTTGLTAAQTTAWSAVSLGCPNYAYQAGGLVTGSFTAFGLAIFPYPLAPQRVNSQYVTGSFGQQNADAVVRAAQIVSWAGLGIPVAGRQTFNGASDGILQGPAYNLAGSTAADAVNQIAVNENTMVAAQPDGTLVYIHKWASFNQSPVAVFSDSTDSSQGSIPFLQAISWDYDNTYLYNANQVTRQYGANNLLTTQAVDFGSRASYFARSANPTTITTMSNLDATGLANWQTAKYAQPALRVSGLTVDAAANPQAAFPAVLSLQQGQVATVTRTPLGGAQISQSTLIQKLHHAIGAGMWNLGLQLSPYTPEDAILQLDASPYNALGGVTLGQ